jgi:hypothetical protein
MEGLRGGDRVGEDELAACADTLATDLAARPRRDAARPPEINHQPAGLLPTRWVGGRNLCLA